MLKTTATHLHAAFGVAAVSACVAITLGAPPASSAAAQPGNTAQFENTTQSGNTAQISNTAQPRVATQGVYINESFQGYGLADVLDWHIEGSGTTTASNGMQGAPWQPHISTIKANNSRFVYTPMTNNCERTGVDAPGAQLDQCTAERSTNRDGGWLTLTTDDTTNSQNQRGGAGQAGTAIYRKDFPSAGGVVVEYDQRVYRTNDGHYGGTPPLQGGGDGISVYLADAHPNNYGDSQVDVTANEPGGYGAGLGYSSVANDGAGHCDAAGHASQGVAGGYLGLGFDVYGNFQKAEFGGLGPNNPATRPALISGANPVVFENVAPSIAATRIPQSIALRGSGVRYLNDPDCASDIARAYGAKKLDAPLVTTKGAITLYQVKWNATDSASSYHGRWQLATGGPTYTITAQDVPMHDLPMEFGDATTGFVKFTIPSSEPVNFGYDRDGQQAGLGTGFYFHSIAQDVSLGDGSTGQFTELFRYTGGYRWLEGTNNLDSPAHNPTTQAASAENISALTGAVIDNVKNDAREYRRVRFVVDPSVEGTEKVTVQWTDKLNVADDRCYNELGVELSGRSADGNTDSCVNPRDGREAGTWQHDKSAELTYHTVFSYELANSAYQAPLPKDLRIGFSASTGWAVNYHQIRNLTVSSMIDLEVNKQVSFLTTQDLDAHGTAAKLDLDRVQWKNEDSGMPGQRVAYRIDAWNNGPTDVMPQYPATLSDGLEAVPFEKASSITWIARAHDGARICKDFNSSTNSCENWVTQLEGTGPITDGEPLMWHAPARDVSQADTLAGVTVIIVGTVANGAGDELIEPAHWYPNTAQVHSNTYGGPHEHLLTNNSDTARIQVSRGIVVNKTWIVNGAQYADGTQPAHAGNAQLTLDIHPAPEFGEIYPVNHGQDTKIGESTSGVAPTCTQAAHITMINGQKTDIPILDAPYLHDISADRLVDVLEITNTVECQTLTLIKRVDGPQGALSMLVEPSQWQLIATSAENNTSVINERPNLPVGDEAATAVAATTTIQVAAGEYVLSEEPAIGSDPAITSPYQQSDWQCTSQDSTGQMSRIDVIDQVVTIPAATDVTCEITNTTAELTVLKQTDSPHFAPEDFTVSATPVDPSYGLENLTATGHTNPQPENTLLVLPDHPYVITEAATNDRLPFVQRSFQKFVESPQCVWDGPSITDDSCWETLTADAAQHVSVAAGERGLYRFVNESPDAVKLPLTGGESAHAFLLAGAALGLTAGALVLINRGRARN